MSEPVDLASAPELESARREEQVPNPAIFSFRPKEYAVLETPEQLLLWEKQMSAHFGLDVNAGAAQSKTFTACPVDIWDDADSDDPF